MTHDEIRRLAAEIEALGPPPRCRCLPDARQTVLSALRDMAVNAEAVWAASGVDLAAVLAGEDHMFLMSLGIVCEPSREQR